MLTSQQTSLILGVPSTSATRSAKQNREIAEIKNGFSKWIGKFTAQVLRWQPMDTQNIITLMTMKGWLGLHMKFK